MEATVESESAIWMLGEVNIPCGGIRVSSLDRRSGMMGRKPDCSRHKLWGTRPREPSIVRIDRWVHRRDNQTQRRKSAEHDSP